MAEPKTKRREASTQHAEKAQPHPCPTCAEKDAKVDILTSELAEAQRSLRALQARRG